MRRLPPETPVKKLIEKLFDRYRFLRLSIRIGQEVVFFSAITISVVVLNFGFRHGGRKSARLSW